MPHAQRNIPADTSLESGYGFPSTSYYEIITDGNKNVLALEIWGSGAPSTDHNNAPLGSIYHDRDATGATYLSYKMTAAATWTEFGDLT